MLVRMVWIGPICYCNLENLGRFSVVCENRHWVASALVRRIHRPLAILHHEKCFLVVPTEVKQWRAKNGEFLWKRLKSKQEFERAIVDVLLVSCVFY